MSASKLFTPIRVGDISLQHRVVLAPLTRFRAQKNHAHSKLGLDYYRQRASSPGTLLITEATFIAPQAAGYDNAPGVWSDEQLVAWKEIVDTVHAKGSFIYLQLWAVGRQGVPSILERDGPYPYVSASDVLLSGRDVAPRPLTVEEIKQYVQWFATGAFNAVHKAGFDGVEIHGANSYLLDQFLQDVSNKRTDEYGGSIENRARFTLEIVDAVVKAVGAEKTAIRLSPWSTYGDMRMKDPVPTFTYLVQQLVNNHPNLSYIHVIEPRVTGDSDQEVNNRESNDFIRKIWAPRPLISAGGFHRELALKTSEKHDNELIAFGRHFLANPDLVLRLKKDLPLTKSDRSTFYVAESAKGYTDYPFAPENVDELAVN
ncbi:putative NADPH2 dehydrogenase chain OYE2 [Cytidiella melzeri]|nr:putative NADPH2 dehydrogenase chain OYE2 [Cytidiella melzeri]